MKLLKLICFIFFIYLIRRIYQAYKAIQKLKIELEAQKQDLNKAKDDAMEAEFKVID